MHRLLQRTTLLVPSLSIALAVPTGAAAALPKVVAGDGVLCDLTRTLSGGATDVRCLIAPGADPHHLQLTPANRRDISQAKVVLINGYNLTPTLAKLRGGFQLIAVGERAVPNNPSRDPHLWHNPLQTRAMAAVVANTLRSLPVSAASKSALQRRQTSVSQILTDLDAWNRRQIATIPAAHRVVVSEHRAFEFFVKRYGIKQVAMIDDYATGGQLRPSSLKAISDAVKASNTKALFAEELPVSKTLRRISRSSGKPVATTPLFADGTAPGKSLIETATANTCAVVNAQGGQCDQAGAAALQRRWQGVR
jgi:zinc/manganese transport system substrate-binding protein